MLSIIEHLIITAQDVFIIPQLYKHCTGNLKKFCDHELSLNSRAASSKSSILNAFTG
ncbi:cysteine rich repeat-containing protein [Lacticaseibacillus manihotivorans]|uniref:cysteine rich repeat-containing protein n=1 Tax=Lacticaseibacillus manihotivorans TaxID=88233 RepID=UPI00138F3B4F